LGIGDWGWGIGDWGLGIGDWGLAANTDLCELKKGEHVEPEAVAELEDRIKARVPSFVFRYSLSISDGPVGVRGHVKNTQILLFHHPHKRILVVHNDSSTIGVFFLRGIHKPFASKCWEMREKEKRENYHDSFAHSYG